MNADHSTFERQVREAIEKLPVHIRENMENVAVCVEETPLSEQAEEAGVRLGNVLLGLYEGVPRSEWGRGFGMQLPDKITIFKAAIESLAQSEEELHELIQMTVWHEIAHHFGYDEEGVTRLEEKWRDKIKKNTV